MRLLPTAAILRQQIETALGNRIPSALTPVTRILRPVMSCGIASVDELLRGGLPLGAITEMVGPECSGRTSLALSFLEQMTRAGKVCAWVDASNALHPESAAAAGVDLARLLWVRCGVLEPVSLSPPSADDFSLQEKYLIPPTIKKGLHGGGFGSHPRNEVKGLSDAVGSFLRPALARGLMLKQRPVKTESLSSCEHGRTVQSRQNQKSTTSGKPWSRIEQALRVTDLLLQAGGLGAIILDMGSIAPEYALRVPLATWFRYRAAAERNQTCILLLTQNACAKSSAGLVLRFHPGSALREEATVFTGTEYRIEIAQERFRTEPTNVVPLRKPPQRTTDASWHSQAAWAAQQ